MKLNLLNFLQSDQTILKSKDIRGHYQTHYIKMESEHPEILYVYYRNFQNEIMNPFNEMKLVGFFCKKSNRLISEDWSFYKFSKESSLDFSGIELVEFSKEHKRAVEFIQAKIKELLPFETETFTKNYELNLYEQKRAKEEAYHHYICSTEVSKHYYSDLFTAKFQYEDFPIFLHYLLDDVETITKVANDFIQKRKEEITERLAYTKLAIKELQHLNRTNQYMERKHMINATEEDMKTIQVTIQKEGKEFSFKMENCLSAKSYRFSTYQMIHPADKAKYQSLFGNYVDFYIDEITEIRYGRKTLFHRKMKAA